MARILENYGLDILKAEGILVVEFSVATSPEEAGAFAEKIGRPVVVKALVPIGKRGKAGAVKFADNSQEATEAARSLLGTEVKGYPVKKVLVAEKVQATNELYFSISINPSSAQIAVVVSLSGGVDIEEVAANSPEKIVTYFSNPLEEFASHHSLEIMSKVGLEGRNLVKVAGLLRKFYQIFNKYDATLLEINPLFITSEGNVIVPACMLSVDDGALFRQKELANVAHEGSERSWKPLTEIERRVQEVHDKDPYRGTARYTELDGGDIGFMCGGGGGSLLSFDEILAAGGKPTNYTEFGGNPPEDKVYGLAKCILSKSSVNGLFVAHNITNNTQVDVEARGIVRAIKEMGIDPATFPIVTRMPGVNEAEGFRILKEAGIECYGEELTMATAAKRMVEKMKQLL
ncbi:MAG: succinate--CoA ligase [Peptococcaceae bacterium BICA1-8]|nr:MAG: succinate--CoA ligase [Peptococcaceae bacterium BICA1-8]